MKKFNLYYRTLRQCHTKNFCETIVAENKTGAFKKAVHIMHISHMDPDYFYEFYVVPVVSHTDDWRNECQGWDDGGDLPRSWES